ncbi:MAG: hypothetical protein NC344_08125 [Bacteroidales bacterium]|nr:hypothetical protein [Bacteroidales bacterium]MCM1147781.1 hypothetical protein [Bacteroidales bacterium]MCM1206609.1 hypothetical protein [Bacillota bacterium]MCM1510650.1 hypothetical protein [Clostridium sp.]
MEYSNPSLIVSKNRKAKTMQSDRYPKAGMARILLLLVLLLCGALQNAAATEKWVVTDRELTVWDSPQYYNKLGIVTRGYEIDAVAIEGDMIRFEYNGQTAYVAAYCCERVADAGTAEKTSAGDAVKTESVTQAGSNAVKAAGTSQAKGKAAGNAMPAGEAVTAASPSAGLWNLLAIPMLLLGLVFMAAALVSIVFTVCYVFAPRKLAAWFNEKCGENVIPAKRLNRLLLPPVYAAIGTMAASVLVSGVGMSVVSCFEPGAMTEPEGMTAVAVVAAFLAGVALVFSVPFFILRHWYRKYRALYGKKAARWMTVYSIMGLVAIYLICVAVAYIVIGLVALLLFLLILCVCFPTRYYLVRR